MRIARFNVQFVLSVMFSSLCSCGGAGKSNQNLPTASNALRSEYAELVERARRFNSDPEHMNHWWLNGEHCFESDLGKTQTFGPDGYPDFPDALRTRVLDFVWQPGAVDFLFDHLLQNRTNESAVLVDAEMLQFFGEMGPAANDPSFVQPSRNAAAVLQAVRSEAFAKAESRYPEAHITEIIEVSARRCKTISE